jgi:hypothetical protein
MESVEATKIYENSDSFPGNRIDNESFIGWKVKVRNLLAQACGAESIHLKQFVEYELPQMYRTPWREFQDLKAVFLAAKEDYEGGYLNSIRNIVAAEVFSIELDQATELLKSNYITAAAVVAGVVIETTLRQMCIDNGIVPASLNKMNEDLSKASVYNSLVQKQVLALAAVRNSAAHGKTSEFTNQDVKNMISQVENFVVQHV